MKVLLYNWSAFDSAAGGGVTVYLRRLIPYLVSEGCEVVFLSQALERRSRSPSIKPSGNIYSDLGVTSFVLEGSEVPFPYRAAFGTREALESPDTLTVFENFVKELDGLSAVHFHGLEGLPSSALSIADRFPKLKILFTAHNYHLVCQQIQLYRLHTQAPCLDYLEGTNCVNCLAGNTSIVPLKEILRERSSVGANVLELASQLKSVIIPKPYSRHSDSLNEGISALTIERDSSFATRAEGFVRWRSENLKYFQAGKVSLLTVSKGAKEVLVGFGLESNSINVIPPATANIDKRSSYRPPQAVGVYPDNKKPFKLSFWGYATPSKGLSLFLDGVTEILANKEIDVELQVLLVSDAGNKFAKQLTKLRHFCNHVEVIESYAEGHFKEISEGVDLAVICPTWQETYSQVAAELYHVGVPVLASSRLGFATQHINHAGFTFNADSITEFKERLILLIKQQDVLAQYWETTSSPPSLKENAERILEQYGRR